jgi:hypothetical protein
MSSKEHLPDWREAASNGRYACLWWLKSAYLAMAVWGTDHYQKLDPRLRSVFEEIVGANELGREVEDIKLACIRSGAPVSDEWLAEVSAYSLKKSSPLDEVTRNRLGRFVAEIGVKIRRLIAAPDGGQRSAKRSPKETKIERAIATLVIHPDWTDKEIAEHATCSPSYLSRNRRFQDARKARQQAAGATLIRGSKDKDSGMVEADGDD